MIANLDELAQYIRENIPQNKSISHLEVQASLDGVTFKWNSMEFLVRKSLDVFQVKEKRIYITAASMLMQVVLTTASKIDRVLAATVESLDQAQDLMKRSDVSKAMQLLDPVKKALAKLVPTRGK